MSTTPTFRDAVADDSASLALLADAATRRLNSWAWDRAAADGQSSFEVGRTTIRSDKSSFLHLAHWRVVAVDGAVAGALNSYLMPAPDIEVPASPVSAVLAPPTELASTRNGATVAATRVRSSLVASAKAWVTVVSDGTDPNSFGPARRCSMLRT